MAKSRERVGFLSLPAELRNRIYELVVTSDDEKESCKESAAICIPSLQPPLTRTCRTIRSETLAMYYSRNRFSYAGCDNEFAKMANELEAGAGVDAVSWSFRNGELLGDAGAWLRAIGKENIALIKHFEFLVASDHFVGVSPSWKVPYRKFAPYNAEVAAVISDCLRRENIFLPACTVFSVSERGRDEDTHRMFSAWKVLPLPTLAESKGWDMVV